MTTTVVDIVIPLFLIVLLAGNAVLVHKSLRMHKFLFAIYEEVVRARKDSESTYSQVEALLSLERHLGFQTPLPPLRGWAASPDFLLAITNYILESRPACILECSSGASTIVAARCMQMQGVGHVYSLEHSPEYAEKTRANLRKHGLEKWATVVDAPLVAYPFYGNARWYSLDNLRIEKASVGLLVVDGPPQNTAALARLPAMLELEPFLQTECAVFLDDADRDDERAIVAKWLERFPDFRFENMWCEKGCAKLTRAQA